MKDYKKMGQAEFFREIERLQRDYITGRVNFNIPRRSRLSHK